MDAKPDLRLKSNRAVVPVVITLANGGRAVTTSGFLPLNLLTKLVITLERALQRLKGYVRANGCGKRGIVLEESH